VRKRGDDVDTRLFAALLAMASAEGWCRTGEVVWQMLYVLRHLDDQENVLSNAEWKKNQRVWWCSLKIHHTKRLRLGVA
jgi:hypothetical protein